MRDSRVERELRYVPFLGGIIRLWPRGMRSLAIYVCIVATRRVVVGSKQGMEHCNYTAEQQEFNLNITQLEMGKCGRDWLRLGGGERWTKIQNWCNRRFPFEMFVKSVTTEPLKGHSKKQKYKMISSARDISLAHDKSLIDISRATLCAPILHRAHNLLLLCTPQVFHVHDIIIMCAWRHWVFPRNLWRKSLFTDSTSCKRGYQFYFEWPFRGSVSCT